MVVEYRIDKMIPNRIKSCKNGIRNLITRRKRKTRTMEKIDLIYKLNGDFENGIDVFELAPVLLSLGNLISESRKTIYPDKPPLAVNVRPFKEGSFDIQIILHPVSNIQKILDIIRSPGGNDIKELLQYIGLIIPPVGATGAGCISLIKLIKWLKGKPKNIEKTNAHELKYIDNNGNGILVDPKIHALYQNISIQQTIYNGIARPFENKHVENIECFIKDDQNTRELIESDIVEPCKNYATGEIPSAEEITENINIRKLWVHPKRISCEGESNSWSFRIVGSDETLKVTNIKDEQFLENVKESRYRLASADKLYIEVQEKQKMQGDKGTMSYEIIRVIEYIMPPHLQQKGLGFNKKEFEKDNHEKD